MLDWGNIIQAYNILCGLVRVLVYVINLAISIIFGTYTSHTQEGDAQKWNKTVVYEYTWTIKV